MNELTLELRGIRNEDEFHDRAAAAFGFPQYYGRNRDAFWDCLTDFVEPTQVRVLNFSTLDDKLRESLADYIMMIEEYASKSNGAFLVVFAGTP